MAFMVPEYSKRVSLRHGNREKKKLKVAHSEFTIGYIIKEERCLIFYAHRE